MPAWTFHAAIAAFTAAVLILDRAARRVGPAPEESPPEGRGAMTRAQALATVAMLLDTEPPEGIHVVAGACRCPAVEVIIVTEWGSMARIKITDRADLPRAAAVVAEAVAGLDAERPDPGPFAGTTFNVPEDAFEEGGRN